MFDGRRYKSFQFAGAMMGLVVVLNLLLFSMGGSVDSDQASETLFLFLPAVIGGILGMGVACYRAWQFVPVNGATRRDGAQAGKRAVLLSYPIMGVIAGVLYAVSSIVRGNGFIGLGIAYAVIAVFVAFVLTAWIAVPVGAVIGGGMVAADGAERQTPLSEAPVPGSEKPARRTSLIFSSGMGLGAVFVSAWVLNPMFSSVRSRADGRADEVFDGMLQMMLLCGVSAFLAGLIVWPLVMGRQEARAKATAAGGLAAVLAFPVLAIVTLILSIFSGGGVAHEPHVTLMGSILFAFFALIFAALPAVIVGSFVGFLTGFLIPNRTMTSYSQSNKVED